MPTGFGEEPLHVEEMTADQPFCAGVILLLGERIQISVCGCPSGSLTE